MASEQELFDKYGVSVKGFCRAVVDALSSELTREDRADYLAFLGGIAYFSEPQFTFEDAAAKYFTAARQLVPEHVMACARLLRIYMEQPDGHKDAALAKECYQILKRKQPMFSKDEQAAFDGALYSVQHNGIKLAELE